jgi:hypothetical protein
MLHKGFILFILLLLLIAGCATTKPPETTTVHTPPVAHIRSISPIELHTGEVVVFDGFGESSNGKVVAYKWLSSLDGELSGKASFSTAALSLGKHKIFFSVRDESGEWSQEATDSVNVVTPIPAPVIKYFEAAPVRIGLKDNSTLRWYVTGATVVSIDQEIGSVNSDGKRVISPKISTRYTLMATNAGGSTSATADIIVVPISNTGLPRINSFAANPGTIASGSFSTLNWNVANADMVQINPGSGIFDAIGNTRVSPKVTTMYTLTAYNSVGMVVGTTQLLVEPEAGAGKPDIVVSDIYKVATSTGVKVGYTIENRGTQTGPASVSRLYANGVFKDIDAVVPLPSGSKVERQFKGWNYNPAANVIEISGDADNNVVESDKSNNVMQVSLPVVEAYDFVASAPLAHWGNDYQVIKFGGSSEDREGFAIYRTDKRLEDATGPAKYLQTSPRATYGGYITGDYEIGHEVKPGDHFYGIVGLLEGATAGNVDFQVYVRAEGENDWHLLGNGLTAYYDYIIKAMVLPLPPDYFGKHVDFRLRVNNVNEPLQNWAVWVEAKIIR